MPKKTLKLPRTIRVVAKQRGRTNIRIDRKRTALKPGVRISKTNRKYYESRANRSDRNIKRKI